jgi:thiaminase/transcriptional activator TenA
VVALRWRQARYREPVTDALSRALWESHQDLAVATLGHPFVRGLSDGALPRQTFAGYVAQDAFFLEAFARAYALALAHSPDRHGIDAFTDLIVGVRDELRLHGEYARRWGIDLSLVDPTDATLAYTRFLHATAARGDTGLTCAAMVPCMRLYAYLGQQLSQEHPHPTYQEWISTYADPAFEALATRLEDLLDRYGDARAGEPYRTAMRLELAFFDSAWNAGRAGQ